MEYLHVFLKDLRWLYPLVATVLFTYLWARMIHLLPYPNARKLILFWGICQNLVLLYFLLTSQWFGSLFLSFGASVYLIESISCLMDVYKKEAIPSHNFIPLFCYLSFIPNYFAGPVLRYRDFVKQWEEPKKRKVVLGLSLILYGFLMKYYFANCFEPFVQLMHASPRFSIAWISVFSNYFQVYYNFWAFSLAAIGVGYCFGFSLPENFKTPVFATSTTSFWDKWNITIGNWVKTYFYLPCALKYKNSKPVSTLLLFFVILFMSLWHGFNLNFLAMGIWFGLWIMFEQVDRYHEKIPPALKGIFTFFIVSTGFLFFEANDLQEANQVFHTLYATFDATLPTDVFLTHTLNSLLCIAAILYCFLHEKSMRLLLKAVKI